jgi:hypothetical protein
MMKGLTKARSVSTRNLMLLLVATALLSHAAVRISLIVNDGPAAGAGGPG